MEWLLWLNTVGYIVGAVGVLLLIWSLLQQGVSLTGVVLLTFGFLALVFVDLIVYFSHS